MHEGAEYIKKKAPILGKDVREIVKRKKGPSEEEKAASQIHDIQMETGGFFRTSAREEQKKELSPENELMLMERLESRFKAHMDRHKVFDWFKFREKLNAREDKMEKLMALHQMEITGGEPDIVFDYATGEYFFFDCSAESPVGRRDLTYKQAVAMAKAMGIQILDDEQYMILQKLGKFDQQSQSWIKSSFMRRTLDKPLIGMIITGIWIYQRGHYKHTGIDSAPIWVEGKYVRDEYHTEPRIDTHYADQKNSNLGFRGCLKI